MNVYSEEIQEIEYIDIDKIFIDEKNRVRTTTGKNVDPLIESIKEYGLFHPIIVNKDYKLIAGYRRLKACKNLGWNTIPTIVRKDTNELDDANIELQENIRRKNLAPYEIDIAIAKWKRIYEQLHPETKHLAHVKSGKRDNQGRVLSRSQKAKLNTYSKKNNNKIEKFKRAKRFTKIIAEISNLSERSVRQRIRIGEVILQKKLDEKIIEMYKKGELNRTQMLKKDKERKKIEKEIIKKKDVKQNNEMNVETIKSSNLIAYNQSENPIMNLKWCKDCKNAVISPCPECGKRILICDKGFFVVRKYNSNNCDEFAP